MTTIITTVVLLTLVFIITRLFRKRSVATTPQRKLNESPILPAKQMHKTKKRFDKLGRYVKGNPFGIYNMPPEFYGSRLLNLRGYSHKQTNKAK